MRIIEEIKQEDYQELASFMITYWPHGIRYWMDRFIFLWDKNPAFSEDPVRGVVVKNNGRIAGFIGKFPVKFQLNRQATVSSNGIGLLLDPSLRGSGLGQALKSKHTELSRGRLIFATSPNKISLKINKAIGFQLLPRGIGDYNTYALLPINMPDTIKLILIFFKWAKSLIPFSVTGHNLGIIKNKHIRSQKLVENNFKTMKINHAGDEFDCLWEETKNLYTNTNIRSAEIINWYLLPTLHAERMVYATYDRDRLMGFAVFRPTIMNEIRLMLCVDLWTRPDNRKEIISSLLTFAREQACLLNYSAVLVPYFSKGISLDLDKIGLLKIIGSKRNDLYLKPKNSDAAIGAENSYFTYMNGDRFLGKYAI